MKGRFTAFAIAAGIACAAAFGCLAEVRKVKIIALADACTTNGFIMARHTNSDALSAAGFASVVVPKIASDAQLAAIMDKVDGLVITGAVVGNEYNVRVAFEKKLVKMALDRKLPVLGFCHGCQLVNLYFGGKIGKVPVGDSPKVVHKGKVSPYVQDCFHEIEIKPGSLVAKVFGSTRATINSSHRACVTEPGEGLEVTARADDGVVEAIEHRTLPVTGFQFHPERMFRKDARCVELIRAALERRFQ